MRNIFGQWQGFAAPQAVGTAQLRNVKTGMRGLNPPIEIKSAILKVDAESVSLEKIAAQTGDTHWTGAVRAPGQCAREGCVFQFDLAPTNCHQANSRSGSRLIPASGRGTGF